MAAIKEGGRASPEHTIGERTILGAREGSQHKGSVLSQWVGAGFKLGSF